MLVFPVGPEVAAMATAVEQMARDDDDDVALRPARAGAVRSR